MHNHTAENTAFTLSSQITDKEFICRKAVVNFVDSLNEAPRLEDPKAGSHGGSERVITRRPSVSLSQPDLAASSSHHDDKAACPSLNSYPIMEGVLSPRPDAFRLTLHSAFHWWKFQSAMQA